LRSSAAGCRLRWPGMSSTEIAAMTAPTALMRKAIVKPAFSARPLARTCVAMMVPATCAPTAEPMLRMTVLTPVASPVWCSSTATTLVIELQRMTRPTESWARDMPRRAPAVTTQPAKKGPFGAPALPDSARDRRDEQREQATGG
jgi:hypothetical protein